MSQHAVKGDTGLKEASFIVSEADLTTDFVSEVGQLLIIRADSQLGVSCVVLGIDLSIGTSEHLFFI